MAVSDEEIDFLVNTLLKEMPEYRSDAQNIHDKKILLRSLMNLRPPLPLDKKFLELQDKFLSYERELKGVVDVNNIPEIQPGICLWQGDITRLSADAIVNAANSGLLGCFIPCHACIDNAIHSSSGLQLRDECNKIMLKQGYPEPVGTAKITDAYNLLCKYVIHTVGPIVSGMLTRSHCEELASCYMSCLELADEHKLSSIAFCCISTGEFKFPNREAAEIALKTVRNFLYNYNKNIRRVIFNVFKNIDLEIYSELLSI